MYSAYQQPQVQSQNQAILAALLGERIPSSVLSSASNAGICGPSATNAWNYPAFMGTASAPSFLNTPFSNITTPYVYGGVHTANIDRLLADTEFKQILCNLAKERGIGMQNCGKFISFF